MLFLRAIFVKETATLNQREGTTEMGQPEPAETSLLPGLGGKEEVPMGRAGGCLWSLTVLHPFKPAASWSEVSEQLGTSLELLDELLHSCMMLDHSGPAQAAGAVPGDDPKIPEQHPLGEMDAAQAGEGVSVHACCSKKAKHR